MADLKAWSHSVRKANFLKKNEINEKLNRTNSRTAMKWKTIQNAPKEENKDENLLIMSKVVVFGQDCSRINSRFLKVSLNITVVVI